MISSLYTLSSKGTTFFYMFTTIKPILSNTFQQSINYPNPIVLAVSEICLLLVFQF